MVKIIKHINLQCGRYSSYNSLNCAIRTYQKTIIIIIISSSSSSSHSGGGGGGGGGSGSSSNHSMRAAQKVLQHDFFIASNLL
jgi:hypothetical protein